MQESNLIIYSIWHGCTIAK